MNDSMGGYLPSSEFLVTQQVGQRLTNSQLLLLKLFLLNTTFSLYNKLSLRILLDDHCYSFIQLASMTGSFRGRTPAQAFFSGALKGFPQSDQSASRIELRGYSVSPCDQWKLGTDHAP